ncbi:hypothetical protein [Achromobacter xylosoxidans]|uniref:hypothetical protein n=1 Tax=Alcaligenes xylosoxydans xylosoxydans TaxID=85698 RepID=UPI001F12FD24|nr:hypothetical protein [Achromobacter xylosoxidans]
MKENNAAQAVEQDPINAAILLLTEEADSISDCHTRTLGDWAGEPEAKAHYDHVRSVVDALSQLRAPVADERVAKLDAECNSLAHQLNASNERGGVLRAVLSDCSAELFAQCGDQPRAMLYVNAARAALERTHVDNSPEFEGIKSAPVAGEAAYYAVLHGKALFGVFDTEAAADECISRAIYPSVMSIHPLYAAPQASAEPTHKPAMSVAEFCAEAGRLGLTADTLAAQLSQRPEFADCLPQADKDGECQPCNGMGIVYGVGDRCPACNGEGLTDRQQRAGDAALARLAEPHTGMRVDYQGLLRQAREGLHDSPGLAEMLRQLQGHLRELGQRWYAGDTAVVDELLQLYCVESNARAALSAPPEPPK